MSKSTHTGTCQICGSAQALPSGRLSKHGYTVEHGWFEGVCPGAHHEPLETSRALADQVVADILREAADLRAKAAKIEAGTVRPVYAPADFYWTCKDRNGRTQDVVVLFADAKPVHQANAVESLLHATKCRAEHAQSVADQIKLRADQTTGIKQLVARAEEAPRKQIVVGSRVKLGGHVVTVTGVADRVAQGVGPYLNGQYLPHFSYVSSAGKTYWYPCRLIRQTSIL